MRTQALYLSNARCKRIIVKCSDVKTCEYLHSHLQQMTHTVTFESMWNLIADQRRNLIWFAEHAESTNKKKMTTKR